MAEDKAQELRQQHLVLLDEHEKKDKECTTSLNNVQKRFDGLRLPGEERQEGRGAENGGKPQQGFD